MSTPPAIAQRARPPRWPEPRLGMVLAVRALLVWGMLRSTLALVAWLHGGMTAPLTLRITASAAAWLVAIVSLLMLVDLHRRGELVLHANFGTGAGMLAAVAALPPLLAELLVLVAAAARG